MGSPAFLVRPQYTGHTMPLLAFVLLWLFLLTGCAASPVPHATTLRSPAAQEGLGCTPLAIGLSGPSWRGYGSGVLVHPRIILPALHITPLDAMHVVAFASRDEAGEAVRIERIVHGGGEACRRGDWAMVVLAHPFQTLAALPAKLPDAAAALSAGDRVLIAGCMFVEDSEDPPFEREAVLIQTTCIVPPPGFPREQGVVIARNSADFERYEGASGGPVLRREDDGTATLAGLYLGLGARSVGGYEIDRHIIIHQAPWEELQRTIAQVEAQGGSAGQ